MGKQKIDISVIIISYNTCQMTIECLESLYKETTSIQFETIVLDNASTDDSVNEIKKRFPQVTLLARKDNLGFAEGNNVAAQHARGEYLLLLNPDTVILDGAVDTLYKFALEHEKAKIWGGKTLFGDRSLNATCCFNFMTPWSLFSRAMGLTALFKNFYFFNSENFGLWKYNTVREVDIITGCFLLIKQSTWNKLKGFDPLFFMFGEEVDLCLRAIKQGSSPLFCPDAVIIHYGGASEQFKADRWEKVFRSKTTLIKVHWKRHIKFGIVMILAWVFTRKLATTLLALVLPGKFKPHKEKWSELWRRRKLWKDGYKIKK